MSRSFYKYLVNDLLLDYFIQNANLEKGSRYYLVIDNEKYRKAVISALKEQSSPIVISNIYSGIQEDCNEEPYETSVLSLPNNLPSIIIASDEDATEDYLTTLRNTVGTRNSEYENYCILYVLQDCSLSSLLTASLDLTSENAPLHPKYIAGKIRDQITTLQIKTFEKEYLYAYLNKLAEDIASNACSLFDFNKVLSVIKKQEIAKNLPELGFFLDSSVLETQRRSRTSMSVQVENNQELFRQVAIIMSNDNDADREILLKKLLDDKLTEKLLSSVKAEKDWRYLVNYQEAQESIDARKANIHLTVERIDCVGYINTLLRNEKIISRYKSQTSLVIGEDNEQSKGIIRVKFNKSVKEHVVANNSNIRTHGNTAIITPERTFENVSFGKGGNKHDILICKLPFKSDFLNQYERTLHVEKNKIVITVSSYEDEGVLSIGTSIESSENAHTISNGDIVAWSDDMRLDIPYCLNGEKQNISFSLTYGAVRIPLKITILPEHEVAQLDPGNIDPLQTYYLSSDFLVTRKVESTKGSEKVSKSWMPYLIREKELIDKSAKYLFAPVSDQLFHDRVFETRELHIDEGIQVCLEKIFLYFKSRQTLPSLVYIDEELACLYRDYIKNVHTSLREAERNTALDVVKYNLTRLGIVEENGIVYFSPFHPLLIAYQLERYEQLKNGNDIGIAKSLITPTYLIPFIYYDSVPLESCQWGDDLRLWNWLRFEKSDHNYHARTSEMTVDIIKTKLESFLTHFDYLFQDQDCPVVLTFVGIRDDSCIVKGILEYIKSSIARGVQKIEIHLYVRDLLLETYYEKLNKMTSDSDRISEIQSSVSPKINLNIKGEYNESEIINTLFSRVKFYKHNISEIKNHLVSSHVTFYQMSSGVSFEKFSAHRIQPELSMKGLLSSPGSVCLDEGNQNQGIRYYIGYGGKHVDSDSAIIPQIAASINTLYAHEKNGLDIQYVKDSCLAKQIQYTDTHIVETLYQNSTWVTFIAPEVDMDFFYRQSDTYIVHYADQYNLGSRYDSITVTKKIEHYRHLIRKPYEQYASLRQEGERFFSSMMKRFNCLCGNWLLGSSRRRTRTQVRERMSLVAASVAMLRLLSRKSEVVWVPISLEEADRISKSIFNKNLLSGSGLISDDLLFLGFDFMHDDALQFYFYPVEVKCTESLNVASVKEKGKQQVLHTYNKLIDLIRGINGFETNMFRTFFASLYLTCADKLNANGLLSKEHYDLISENRYNILNLNYLVEDTVPVVELGQAAVVTFSAQRATCFNSNVHEGLALCDIIFSMRDCIDFIANPESTSLDYLRDVDIHCSSEEVQQSDVAILSSRDLVEANEDKVSPEVSDSSAYVIPDNDINERKPVVHQQESLLPNQNGKEQNVSSGIKVELGVNPVNKQKVYYEPNNTNKLTNPNMAIIGIMGTGKTQQALSIVSQLAKQTENNVGKTPVGMLIFDYKGDDYSKEKFLNIVDGTVHNSNFPFNPLKLIPPNNSLVGNLPAITADNISGAFATVYNLGPIQKNNIYNVILETYKDVGITEDPNTWGNKVPTMNDVVRKYLESYNANDKAYALLQRFQHFSIFEQNPEHCVSMFEWLDRVRVIDLSGYGGDDTKKVIVSLILDLFYAEMKQLGESLLDGSLRALRAMVLVDEAHHFLSKDFKSLRSIISEGRMFGVGIILSTQTLNDFKAASNDYAEYILSWLIHNVNKISVNDICNTLSVEKHDASKFLQYIRNARKHESLCKLGNRIVNLRDLPFFELLQRDVARSKID